jgi:hypothetical protein
VRISREASAGMEGRIATRQRGSGEGRLEPAGDVGAVIFSTRLESVAVLRPATGGKSAEATVLATTSVVN